LTAGYQGPGAKTVIGSWASAKVSMRLVPKQDSMKIQAAFRKTIRDRAPKNVKVEFTLEGHKRPSCCRAHDNKATKLAGEALKIGFGRETCPDTGRRNDSCGWIVEAGTWVDSLLVGFGLPNDRVHSPNEKFDLDAFYRGKRTAAALYERLAQMK
jgi:acetylornithine deacetylase/succinyl-diaminopimelate desuccinylase-like protein